MPKFTVVDQSEFEKRSKESVGRHAYLPEYMEYLSQIPDGFGAVLELDEDEKKQTLKNRINHAARELGKQIRFVRHDVTGVKFQIVGDLTADATGDAEYEEVEEAEAVPA